MADFQILQSLTDLHAHQTLLSHLFIFLHVELITHTHEESTINNPFEYQAIMEANIHPGTQQQLPRATFQCCQCCTIYRYARTYNTLCDSLYGKSGLLRHLVPLWGKQVKFNQFPFTAISTYPSRNHYHCTPTSHTKARVTWTEWWSSSTS